MFEKVYIVFVILNKPTASFKKGTHVSQTSADLSLREQSLSNAGVVHEQLPRIEKFDQCVHSNSLIPPEFSYSLFRKGIPTLCEFCEKLFMADCIDPAQTSGPAFMEVG
jgi:hypothetical protein